MSRPRKYRRRCRDHEIDRRVRVLVDRDVDPQRTDGALMHAAETKHRRPCLRRPRRRRSSRLFSWLLIACCPKRRRTSKRSLVIRRDVANQMPRVAFSTWSAQKCILPHGATPQGANPRWRWLTRRIARINATSSLSNWQLPPSRRRTNRINENCAWMGSERRRARPACGTSREAKNNALWLNWH